MELQMNELSGSENDRADWQTVGKPHQKIAELLRFEIDVSRWRLTVYRCIIFSVLHDLIGEYIFFGFTGRMHCFEKTYIISCGNQKVVTLAL